MLNQLTISRLHGEDMQENNRFDCQEILQIVNDETFEKCLPPLTGFKAKLKILHFERGKAKFKHRHTLTLGFL